MKTKKPETPAPGLSAGHAALVVVLDQFNLSLVQFLRQPTFSYEHRIAANSLDDLTRLYCLLTQPGLCMRDAARQCPVWPTGRFAGQRPDSSTLCRIKKRLLPRPADAVVTEPVAERKLQLERKKLRLREKDLQLKDKQIALEQDKFNQVLATARPSQPTLPISRETPRQMIKRVYGYNPFEK